MPCACMCASTCQQTLLINSEDQSWHMLKVLWRSNFIWLIYWGVSHWWKKHDTTPKDRQTNIQTLLKFILEAALWKQEQLFLEVHTWRMLMVPDWGLGGWGHPWHHGSSWLVILYFCAKFQLSSMIRSVKNPPSSKSILGGRWWFLTGVMEDWVIFDIIYHLDRPHWSFPESFMKIWLHLAEILNA